VLARVSLSIESGELVALVGRTGSGKSTLARLLIGLERPQSGRVLYDGRDLVTLDLASVRSRIGVSLQHPYLFGGTIRSNLALGRRVSDQEMAAACRMARIDREIAAMPMGYDSMIADGGSSLSGGQRQRLALARALIADPAILLLDEATSALDALTELEVHEQIARLTCTRIVIAHRLSTIRNADRILVLSEGRIVEQGSHVELLSRCGSYAALIAAQLENGSAA
jgi:ATP-binding cassette, subfamily B, bacterial